MWIHAWEPVVGTRSARPSTISPCAVALWGCLGTLSFSALQYRVYYLPIHNYLCITRGVSFKPSFTLPEDVAVSRPCYPSPCGPNSHCQEVNGIAVCKCVEGFVGNPPICRPECVVSSDCQLTRACINQKCRDPCLGSCGLNAECSVINHNPVCRCPPSMTGDPFSGCTIFGEEFRSSSLIIRGRSVVCLRSFH